jgi:hypothetical protein
MRTLSTLGIVLILLLNSCSKDDDPKFTSAEGDWTYTTKDKKISVDFTLAKDGTTWSVKNAVIRVDGTAAKNTVVEFDGIVPPSIQYIRINANDIDLVYPYPINFTNATVNSDFTAINVPDATYTWPNDRVNSITDITITRK